MIIKQRRNEIMPETELKRKVALNLANMYETKCQELEQKRNELNQSKEENIIGE